MSGLSLRAVFIFAVALILSSCGTRPRPAPEVQQVYEIRAATVTANAGVPRSLLRGIKRRMDRAIADTTRPALLPRAVMNIHVVGIQTDRNGDGIRSQTEISVALTDVPSGQALLVRSFLVFAFSIDANDGAEAAAEAVAARLRVEYALAQPGIRKAPATVYRPEISTRMEGEIKPARLDKVERPIVIPLKTAPVLGADQDPILNSKTRVKNKDIAPAAETVTPDAAEKKQPVAAAPAENVLETGAKAKVVIGGSKPATDEPCVETMDNKC